MEYPAPGLDLHLDLGVRGRMATWQTAQCPPLPRPTRAPAMDFGKSPL
jgi:hypothetical protein